MIMFKFNKKAKDEIVGLIIDILKNGNGVKFMRQYRKNGIFFVFAEINISGIARTEIIGNFAHTN